MSIGLPVFNGEDFLSYAIESILAQTYTDFELIISDNASTDATETIYRGYAAQDPRIRYCRRQVNLGAAPNFNHVFKLARESKYFKWAAHDDWIAPTFLEECVRALENNPDAVLCQSLVERVDADADGRRFLTYDYTATGTDLPRPCDRVRARLRDHSGMGLYGVIRSEVLASTGLMGSHCTGDFTLLLELALCGRFVLVPHCLFVNRCHSENYFNSLRARSDRTPQEELAWWCAPEKRGQPGWLACKKWVMYIGYLRIIRARVRSRADRIRCYSYLLHSLSLQAWIRLVFEPLMALDPRLFRAFMKLRRLVTPNASADSTTQMNEGSLITGSLESLWWRRPRRNRGR